MPGSDATPVREPSASAEGRRRAARGTSVDGPTAAGFGSGDAAPVEDDGATVTIELRRTDAEPTTEEHA